MSNDHQKIRFVSALLLTIWLNLPGSAMAATCERKSPAHTVALVELYTSEGCSSCPPADRWLTELSSRFTTDQVVPLSLHVDYWDYIGWSDPFAQAQFSERQRLLGRLSRSSTVYTPEVFVGMREFQRWHRSSDFNERIREINSKPAQANIVLTMSPSGENRLDLSATITVPSSGIAQAGLQGVVVLYERQVSSAVTAGENRGATLKHENVVRYASDPFPLDAQREATTWTQPLKIPPGWRKDRLGAASYVQNPRTGEILQSIAIPGCG